MKSGNFLSFSRIKRAQNYAPLFGKKAVLTKSGKSGRWSSTVSDANARPYTPSRAIETRQSACLEKAAGVAHGDRALIPPD